MANVDLRTRRVPAPRSALWHLNAVLARPIAAVFSLLGVAPGQLSLQSLTLTAVGLIRMAGGDRWHVIQGAAIVYGALLLDRADDWLARDRTPAAWTRFLGAMVDRVIEVALIIALAWLALQSPSWPLPRTSFLLVLAGVLGSLLLARTAVPYGDLLVLRMHLVNSRRLPGPSAVSRVPQAQPWLSRLFDRDAFILVWVVGVVTSWLQPAAFLLFAMHLLLTIEAFVLVWSRRKDPEPHAADVLARGP